MLGLAEADSELEGLGDCDALILADRLDDGLSEADGDGESEELMLGLTDGLTLSLIDGETEAEGDGETLADGEPADTPNDITVMLLRSAYPN